MDGDGEAGWFSNRERRWVDKRGGRGGFGSGMGGGVGSEGVGLRMLENHFWTAEAGEMSAAGSGGVESVKAAIWEFFGVWLLLFFADFVSISPPKPSTALCLLFQLRDGIQQVKEYLSV